MEHKPLQNQPQPKSLSNYQVDNRAAEAQAILDNPVFQEAYEEAYSKAAYQLLNADVGSLTASTAHATMKSIMALRNQLEQYVLDKKMREKFSKGDGNAG